MVGEDLLGGGFAALFGAFFLVFALIGLALYIYVALAYMTIAKKTKTDNGWLAFIPIANIYLLTQIAEISGWWTLLVLIAWIPILGGLALAALMIYLNWKVFERVGKPGWWALIALIPVVGSIIYLVLLGIAAWGKK